MLYMHGIASESGKVFLGVLQPVLGIGAYLPEENMEMWAEDAAPYKVYYPSYEKYVTQHPDFLFNLTGIFDTAKGNVFIDYCHINDPYQMVVAQNIFEALLKKGCFQ